MAQLRGATESNAVARPAGNRPSRAAVAVVAAVLAAACAPALAGPTGAEIIAKVREAHKTATYEGVRVLELWSPRGKIKVKQRAIFGGDGRQRFEVIWPEDRAGDLVVCDGRQQWRYSPRQKTVYILPPIPPPYGMPPGHGHRRHAGCRGPQWKLTGREEVAGRECYVLELTTPMGRRLARLWVDTERFVILGGEFASPRAGQRWKFETVSFSPKIKPDTFTFRPPPGTRVVRRMPTARRMSLQKAQLLARMRAILPAKLPDGYVLLADRVGVIERGGRRALWFVFSNGAQTFSIFQSRRLPANIKLPPGTAARWDIGPYTLIVVGDLSADDLEAMRQSLPPPPFRGRGRPPVRSR